MGPFVLVFVVVLCLKTTTTGRTGRSFVRTDHVELMLFPEYSTLVSAERNLEEYPLF